jgi:TetR/AcrR family fatty acid metabolism transcriptional regulator
MDEVKKENILNVAERFFSQLGFKKTSVNEIAQACGIAKGTIYLACKSKEDLLYQVLLKQCHKVSAEYFSMINPDEPADQILLKITDQSIENLHKYPLIKNLLFGNLKKHLMSVIPKLNELRRINFLPIKEVLELGIRQGIFRKDIDVEMTCELLLDIHMASYLVHADKDMNIKDLDRRKKAVMDIIFRGIKG